MKTFIKNRKESTEDQTVVNDDAKNELIQRSVTLIIIILYYTSYYKSNIKNLNRQ